MGWFGRRRTAVIEDEAYPVGLAWQPSPGGVLVTSGEMMDDDGCAGQAIGARFYLDAAHDAALTIWAYPTWGAPEGGDYLIVGYRVDHEVGSWTAATYHGDVAWGEWYSDVAAAGTGAWVAAEALLKEGLDAAAVDLDPDVVAEWFDWDGVPW